MGLHEYIHSVSEAIARQQGGRLQALLTINPPQQQGGERASWGEPNDVDLFALPDKFHAVVRRYLKAMRLIYVVSDINELFYDLNELVVCLSRAAETQANWVCAALINCADELLSLHQVREKGRAKGARSAEDEANGGKTAATADGAGPDGLELVAATINKLFKVCLTDKSLDAQTSKKCCIHFFLAALIKIYFRLNKLELAKSMEKALLGTGLAIPTIVNSPVEYRKYTVTYLYFSALLSLDEADFDLAKAKLLTAMEFLSCYKKQQKVALQTEKILFLLVPLKALERVLLPDLVYDKFATLKLVYRDNLLRAVRKGNLRLFDRCVQSYRRVFLSRHIYLLVVHLRSLCQLKLVQRAATAYASIGPTPHIVPYSAIQLALEMLVHGSEENGVWTLPDSLESQDYSFSPEETECILANLIAKRWIKGYMSHANKCIVLSKTLAFPKV